MLPAPATRRLILLSGVLLLAGCQTGVKVPATSEVAPNRLLVTPWAGVVWQPFPLPSKRYVPFEPAQVDGRPALRVQADSSVSILRQRVSVASDGLTGPLQLRLSWRADALPSDGDLAHVDRSDSPVGVLLAFEGDRSRWTARQHRLSDLTQLLTGEPLPYATLAYVWSAQHPVDSVVFK